MTQQPLDADAVLRDDLLLDALGRGEMLPDYDDDATARMLLAWRDDLATAAGLPDFELAPADLPEFEPVHTTADLPEVAPVRSIGTAKVPVTPVEESRRFRWTRRMTVAAAFTAFAAGSVGSVAAAGVAEPGSPLWPITKVVYEDRAKSLEAREGALSLLREAQDAAENNDPERARELLDTALATAGDVVDEADRDKIMAQADKVEEQLAEPPVDPSPSTTPSPDPQPSPSTEPSAEPSPSTPPSTEPTPGNTDPTPETTPSPSSEPSVDGGAPNGPDQTPPT